MVSTCSQQRRIVPLHTDAGMKHLPPLAETLFLIGVLVMIAVLLVKPGGTALAPKFALATMLIFAALAVVASLRSSSRKRRAIFHARDPVSVDEILSVLYGSESLDRALVKKLWVEYAELLGVPPEQLRGADRFAVELAPVDGLHALNDELDDLLCHVSFRARSKGANLDIETISTFGELVRAMAKIEMGSR